MGTAAAGFVSPRLSGCQPLAAGGVPGRFAFFPFSFLRFLQ